MSIERNKKIVQQLLDSHDRHDRQRASEILSPKLTWHMSGESRVMGRDDYLEGFETGARAFSDVWHEVQTLVAEQDHVTALTSWRMRHTGEFLDIQPTDRVVEFTALWLFRIVDDRVVDIWSFDEDFTPALREKSAQPS